MRHASPFLLAATLAMTHAVIARAQSSDAAAAPLPVRAVTLFSSGVSYTLREGEVSGSATVPLTFRTAQINDILKSLVLLDESGTVRPAVYAAKDPIGRTLQSFAVDVTQPTGRADLLNRLRGARVSVETAEGRQKIEGQIVGVETREVSVGEKTVVQETLTVLGDGGIQSVRLDDVRSVRLLDDRLNREFREALSLLAAGADDRRRQVTLRFDGNGKRRVRVGYVSEAPLWKVSYRLLIGGTGAAQKGGTAAAAGGDKPYLQGWALVENTTDDDWTNVQLSLVSGRPVSFIQDLYQPLYLPRPVVPPDVIASPYPQLAEANIETQQARDGAVSEAEAASPPPPAASPAPSRMGRPMAKSTAGGFGGGASEVNALVAPEPNLNPALAPYALRNSSVAAGATGARTGELFEYRIATPVTLPRQQAAMIPVIAQEIAGDKVSVYNPDADARFPLNAFRIRNDTKLHLKGGPVTLFDNGTYAGDARMEDVPPGDDRLITYAVDLSVEGERQGPIYSGVEIALSLRRGVLTITRRDRQETRYTLKSKAEQPRTVLVEHPFDAEYKLVEPAKFSARTPSRYRFEVVVPPGQTEKLTVVTERPISQTVGLLNQDLSTLELYVRRGDVPERIKDALREVLQRRRRIQELQSQAAAAESEVASIDKDQERIRKNMTALDKASALYKRYVSQLDQQESRIQALRAEANRLRSAAAAADRDLRAYLDDLTITP
jgi:hypothetical protein